MNEEGKQYLSQAEMNQEDPKASGRGGPVDVRFWDCDSCLYDSFELKSFKRQLDSAIASRTLSMPRVAQVAVSRTSPEPPRDLQGKSSSRISRSLRKLLRPFFSREKPKTAGPNKYPVDGRSEDGYYVLYQSSGRLLTVVPPDHHHHQFANSLAISPAADDARVRRAESERFTGRISGVPSA